MRNLRTNRARGPGILLVAALLTTPVCLGSSDLHPSPLAVEGLENSAVAGGGGIDSPLATCTVPGSHATIQAAIDDPSCDPIVLEDSVYTESPTISRGLDLVGLPSMSVVQGRIMIVGPGTDVTVQNLAIEAFMPMIFSDGFESGDTSAWSNTVP